MKNLKLKAARAAKDLSQDELARLCGVSRQTISALEKGDYNPTINLCIAICRALDKTLDELFWEGLAHRLKMKTVMSPGLQEPGLYATMEAGNSVGRGVFHAPREKRLSAAGSRRDGLYPLRRR